MLEPVIVPKPELTVVGLQATFKHALSAEPTNFKVIPPLWDRLFQRVDEIKNRSDHDMYGVLWSEPQRNHPDEMEYLAGVAVGDIANVPDGMAAHTVPAGMFAVFTHRGPIQNIGATMREIYRVWLPSSKYRHAGMGDVEVYDHRFCADGAESEMEYWISIVPR